MTYSSLFRVAPLDLHNDEDGQGAAAGRLQVSYERLPWCEELLPVIYTTTKMAKVLLLGGYKYRANGSRGAKVRWRCATHERFRCRAVVHTIQGTVVYIKGDHNTGA
ncbi:unnamed protein product, partial [Iphiclides podalirius]